jgi:hypothetical protein
MTDEELGQRLAAVQHVVHEYANFVSSAEMVLHGADIDGVYFKPPINTHVSHAFYLNCRKLADFFRNRKSLDGDNVMAEHFVPGFCTELRTFTDWRIPINKQLAHVTYARDTKAREIDKATCTNLYEELQEAWRTFRKRLVGGPFEAEFTNTVKERKQPLPTGELSPFGNYDLD